MKGLTLAFHQISNPIQRCLANFFDVVTDTSYCLSDVHSLLIELSYIFFAFTFPPLFKSQNRVRSGQLGMGWVHNIVCNQVK